MLNMCIYVNMSICIYVYMYVYIDTYVVVANSIHHSTCSRCALVSRVSEFGLLKDDLILGAEVGTRSLLGRFQDTLGESQTKTWI